MALPTKLFNLNVEPVIAPVALPHADEIGQKDQQVQEQSERSRSIGC